MSKWSVVIGLVVVLALVAVLMTLVHIESTRTKQTLEAERESAPVQGAEQGTHNLPTAPGIVKRGPKIDFLKPTPIGFPVGDTKPWITHAKIVDLNEDGLKDVVVCDATSNRISWIEHSTDGQYAEKLVGDTILAPAHVEAIDFDKDGDLDLLIAKMGAIAPTNDKIGGVVVMENDGTQQFTNHVLIDQVARVADVRRRRL